MYQLYSVEGGYKWKPPVRDVRGDHPIRAKRVSSGLTVHSLFKDLGHAGVFVYAIPQHLDKGDGSLLTELPVRYHAHKRAHKYYNIPVIKSLGYVFHKASIRASTHPLLNRPISPGTRIPYPHTSQPLDFDCRGLHIVKLI